MASVLKFTTTSYLNTESDRVDFIGDAAYRVVTWSPAVARRATGMLGGRGPYEDVDEEMTITISGSSALEKLQTLLNVLDQAERWARGENVRKVMLRYKPTASSVEVKAVVLGGSVALPPNFALSPVIQMIDPVTVRFRRTGLWLGDDEVKTDTTTGNPEVAVATGFEWWRAASPIKVEIEGLTHTFDNVSGSFVLISCAEDSTRAPRRIYVVSGSSLAGGGIYTSVSDSANKARDNTVLRLTSAIADSYHDTVELPISTNNADQYARRWGVFLNYRNNSATASWRVRARFWFNDSDLDSAETNELIIPAGASDPTWAFVGTATLPTYMEELGLSIWASEDGETLDIDDIVLMAMDHADGDWVIAIKPRVSGGSISGTADLIIDHQSLERPGAAVYVLDGSARSRWPFQGDAAVYMREGCTAVAVAWLSTGRPTVGYWRSVDGASAVQAPSLRVTRTNGYLTPG